jgi:hypothetical protein
VSIYLDVRPAVDSAGALVARLSFAFRQRFQPFRYALCTVDCGLWTVYCVLYVLMEQYVLYVVYVLYI